MIINNKCNDVLTMKAFDKTTDDQNIKANITMHKHTS